MITREALLSAVRSRGERGATVEQVAFELDIPMNSANLKEIRGVLRLLREERAIVSEVLSQNHIVYHAKDAK